MFNRLNRLSFIIGLFFLLVSLVLIGGYFFIDSLQASINLYTGTGFFIFGILMMTLQGKK